LDREPSSGLLNRESEMKGKREQYRPEFKANTVYLGKLCTA
jgi:hypothetical protein